MVDTLPLTKIGKVDKKRLVEVGKEGLLNGKNK